MNEEYYLQDSRSYVGNDVLWWAIDGCGYTTDLRKAHVFSKDEAVSYNESRATDIPWPKKYIDDKTRPAVDMQCIRIKDALRGSGIKLAEKKRYRRINNCVACGKFISLEQVYGARECACGYVNEG